jgi:hypothetical protein
MTNKTLFCVATTTLLAANVAAQNLESWTDRAIAPVTNPVFFETPLIQSEVRPLFLYHRLDKDLLGADVDVRLYALQVRYAINDRLAIIATKDGFIQLDPKGGGKDDDGWADLAAGLKYAVYQNPEAQFILTPGFTFEFPTGNNRVYQANGSGEANVFVSAMKGFGDLHLNFNVGGRLPIDWDEETASLHYSAMVDYFTCRWFIPFVTLNAFTTLSEGTGLAIESEGFDLINFGSQKASGETQAAWGVGFRSRLHSKVDLGFAYEQGFAPDNDIFKDRFTVDMIWRF